MPRSLILLLLSFHIHSVYPQQPASYEIYGYGKYALSTSEIPYFQNRFYDQLVHARLNSRWYPTDQLTGAMELRLRAYYGDSVEHLPGFKDLSQIEYEFNDLGKELFSTQRSYGYLEIDRFYLDYQINAVNLTLGRQRIAWGTSLVWNVIDLFNPMSILEFDYEERPAVDALRLQYYTGPLSKIEIACKPAHDIYHSTTAALWSFNKARYDFFIITALWNKRQTVGFAWSGDIYGGGFRGEVLIAESPYQRSLFYHPDNIFLKKEKMMFTFVLSGDYTFKNSLYLHTELLHNNYGIKDKSGQYNLQASEAGMFSPALWSVYQEVSYNITPLIRGSFFTLFNPYDRSQLLVPSVSYNLFTNLEVYLLGYQSSGNRQTEFGSMGNYFSLHLKYSF
jgi:hypothetical protein